MCDLCRLIWCALIGLFRSRAALEAENVVLRHQLNVLRRKSPKRVALSSIDRLLLVGPCSCVRQDVREDHAGKMAAELVRASPLIRPSGTFSHKGRRGWSRKLSVVTPLPLWERDSLRRVQRSKQGEG